MILAAGEGRRMRPLTLHTPKPLVEVAGKTLIERHLERLARAGITECVVNLHHLGDQIRAFLGDGERLGVRIHYSEETELLETGGGIIKALPWLGEEPFVVVSADLCTDFDFALLARPLAADALGHLVMVDNPPHHPAGDFAFTNREAGDRRHLSLLGAPRYNYGGIALLSPALFADHPLERVPLRPFFERAIEAGRMTGERFAGLWINIGTEAHLASARDAVARG